MGRYALTDRTWREGLILDSCALERFAEASRAGMAVTSLLREPLQTASLRRLATHRVVSIGSFGTFHGNLGWGRLVMRRWRQLRGSVIRGAIYTGWPRHRLASSPGAEIEPVTCSVSVMQSRAPRSDRLMLPLSEYSGHPRSSCISCSAYRV